LSLYFASQSFLGDVKTASTYAQHHICFLHGMHFRDDLPSVRITEIRIEEEIYKPDIFDNPHQSLRIV